jgi:hypothetical protein
MTELRSVGGADPMIRASAMIKQYYLRQHFGACFAQENYDRYRDCNPSRAMLFAHAPYYPKFHEAIAYGYPGLSLSYVSGSRCD